MGTGHGAGSKIRTKDDRVLSLDARVDDERRSRRKTLQPVPAVWAPDQARRALHRADSRRPVGPRTVCRRPASYSRRDRGMRVTIDGPVTFDGDAWTLSDDQVEQLRAQLGVESSIRTEDEPEMLTTAQAAKRLGYGVDYVRDHAAELGGVKLTDSPKAQWRFAPAKLGGADAAPPQPVADSPTSTRRRRAPRRAGSGQLLQSRGR